MTPVYSLSDRSKRAISIRTYNQAVDLKIQLSRACSGSGLFGQSKKALNGCLGSLRHPLVMGLISLTSFDTFDYFIDSFGTKRGK
jgi:hypothetical protein